MKTVIENGVTYELDTTNLTAQIVYSPNAKGDIFIPCQIKYQSQEYPILGIQKNSFTKNMNIKSIKFSDDSRLLSIKKKSFCNSHIKAINIPSSVEELEEGWSIKAHKLKKVTVSPNNPHFKYLDDEHQIIIGKSDKSTKNFDVIIYSHRSIEKVTIPPYIKRIASYAFLCCKQLTQIEIPDDSNLESIGKKAFHSSSLKSIKIPSSVKKLEEGWQLSSQFISVEISPNNKNFKYLDDKHQIIIGKSDINSENFDVIICSDRSIEKVVIPSYIKRIASYAFFCCKQLTQIEIPDDSKLESIGKNAFHSSSLKSIKIPSSVKKLEEGWCDFTDFSVDISPNCEHIKYSDENRNIIIGKSDINSDKFDVIVYANKSIEKATIPCYVKRINSYVFRDCKKLQNVEFSENSQLKVIGKRTFESAPIQRIIIPKSVEEIGKSSFSLCRMLKEVILENGSKLTSISDNLFFFTSLTKFEIPKDSELRMICDNPFFFCKIDELYIPSKFESFHENWCYTNLNIKLIVSPDNKNFKYADKEHQLLIGKSDLNSENFDVVVFADRSITNVKIPSTIKYISSYAFADCTQLGSIDIPNDSQIVSFGKESFFYCSIKKLFIPANFESFGYNCCSSADHLTNIIFSPHNKNFKYDKKSKLIIGKSDSNSDNFDVIIFANRSIEKAVIPSTIKIISPHAFMRCKKLRTIEFEKNSCLETIDCYSFSDTNIKKVVIPKSVEKIKHHAFNDCVQLKTFSIEEGSKLKALSKEVFAWCSRLEAIEIPDNSSIHKIEKGFICLSSLEKFTIPPNVDEIKDEWCRKAKLKEVTISPKNKNFIYDGDDNQFIIGKSKNVYDILIFVKQSVKNVIIPSNITKIYANMSLCKNLESFEFLADELLNACDFFQDSQSVVIISFPNLNEFIMHTDLYNAKSSKFLLLIKANAKML